MYWQSHLSSSSGVISTQPLPLYPILRSKEKGLWVFFLSYHVWAGGCWLTSALGCSLGSELPYGLGPLKWAPAVGLQDHGTERHQKRVRTIFNLQQLQELEKVFAKQHNLVGKERAQLAARLHLTENQVRTGT